jgi:hypothetical protein
LRQSVVARAVGCSDASISRVERGLANHVGLTDLATMLSVVGLDLSARAYPGGQPLRDEGHRLLLDRFRAMLPAGTPWRTEVPLPGPGDQRAWDAAIELWRLRVGVEAESRPTDLQELGRRLGLKWRDGGMDRMVLVLADTRANRAFLCQAGDSLRAMFPLQGRAAVAALRQAEDPSCNLLLLA